jgi:Tol biopolymer transport system component
MGNSSLRKTCLASALGALTLAAGVCGALGQGIQLVTPRNPAAARPPDFFNSVSPTISADGRYVVFVSSANTLVPGDNNQLGTDIFVRDRTNQTTTLVSTNFNGTGGGNGLSGGAMMSTNGRYVLFESDSSDLVPGDTNGVSDIFLRDLVAGTTTLVSVATNGGFGNGASTDAAMTPDGRYVAFLSLANNLVPGDANGILDVYVRDMIGGTTMLVSVGATNPVSPPVGPPLPPVMGAPIITQDGRFVAFFSTANGLVQGTPTSYGNVFVRDLLAGTTLLGNTNLTATTVNQGYHPSLSSNGLYLAFNFGSVRTNSSLSAYRRDLVAGTTNTIATNTAYPMQSAVDDIYGPEISADGRYVVYLARTNINNTNYSSVHIWDGLSSTDILVSQDQFGGFPSNTYSDTPVMSPDGRYVAFLSTATNLVPNAVSPGTHLYLRDLQGGVTQLIDVDINGVGSSDVVGAFPSISPDGRYVAFAAPDGQLVAGDSNGAYDVFLRDTLAGTTERISAPDGGANNQAGAAASMLYSQTAVSADGRYVVFTSRADDLVTNDFNSDQDVFVADTFTGPITLVSLATNGNSGLGGYSAAPAMSADGRYVAFVSAATNLVSGDTNLHTRILVRDLLAGTTVNASVTSASVPLGNGDASLPVISQDGRYVAFLCRTNLSFSNTGLFWRDLLAGQTVAVNLSVSTNIGPSISADGRYVCYLDASLHLFVYDTVGATNVYSNIASMSLALMNPTGTWVAYQLTGNNSVAVLNIPSAGPQSTFLTSTPIRGPAQWSGDGRYFAFVSSFSLAPGDANAALDVYLYDTQTGTLTLVSANSAGTGSGNSASDSPALSGDGRFVVYRSFGSNIVAGTSNSPNLFVFDRLTGSNTLLTIEPPVSSWTYWSGNPAISADGSYVAYNSVRPRATGPVDLNRAADIFAAPQSFLVFTDTDGDGIPDWWTQKYFGHPTGLAGDLSRAQDDPDGDGMTNLQEYIAGTNPKDAASVLQLVLKSLVAGTSVQLSWPAIPGKNYKVQIKGDLNAAQWQDLGGSATVVGNTGYFNSAFNGVAARYYRVVAVN